MQFRFRARNFSAHANSARVPYLRSGICCNETESGNTLGPISIRDQPWLNERKALFFSESRCWLFSASFDLCRLVSTVNRVQNRTHLQLT